MKRGLVRTSATSRGRSRSTVNSPIMKEWLSTNPVDAEDMLRHDKWLCMMWPRLVLLRELLSERGSLWMTLDDNEVHRARGVMDEIFGESNFVATCIWHKMDSPKNTAEHFSVDHDYLHVYAKSADQWASNLLPRTEGMLARYQNPDNDPRGPWRLGPIFAPEERHEGLMYTVTTPSGRQVSPPKGSHWRMVEVDFWRMVEEGRISFGANGTNNPAVKLFLNEVQAGVVPRSIWPHSEAGHTQDAKREVMALFPGETPFGTPKPERLLQRILHIASNPGDLVLDSFLGSGTTAAVAHKMGRRWIGIEMGEHAATHCLPRLQKVLAGEQGGISQAVGWQGGGGFRFARLGAPVFDAQGCIHPEVRFATLAAFVWQQETGTAFDSANGQAGTPWLGTHSVFDSFSRLPDAPEAAIPPETEPPELVLRSRTAYYLLFNGILGDKRPASGNVLTRAVLDALLQLHAATPHPDAPLVVYGEANRLGPETLARARVTFKHIPYDVKAR